MKPTTSLYNLKRGFIEVNDLSIGTVAYLLGMYRITLSKIANTKGAITSNIALRIEKAFVGNADFWLRMQRGYDLIKELENTDLSKQTNITVSCFF